MTNPSAVDVKAMLRARVDLFARVGEIAPAVEQAAAACIDALRSGGTVWTCGNGGSAAEAQHFAAELVAATSASATHCARCACPTTLRP